MRLVKSATWIVLALVVAVNAGGCGEVAMALPSSLAGKVDRMPVDRPKVQSTLVNETWKFGGYTVSELDRGGKRSSGMGSGGVMMTKGSQKFEYQLVAPGDKTLSASCELSSRGGASGGFTMKNYKMSCSFEAEGAAPWILAADRATKGDDVAGTLGAEGVAIEIVGNFEIEDGGSSAMPVGYTFRDPQGDLGAVDLSNPGVVYLLEGLDETKAAGIACAAVALVLYKESV